MQNVDGAINDLNLAIPYAAGSQKDTGKKDNYLNSAVGKIDTALTEINYGNIKQRWKSPLAWTYVNALVSKARDRIDEKVPYFNSGRNADDDYAQQMIQGARLMLVDSKVWINRLCGGT